MPDKKISVIWKEKDLSAVILILSSVDEDMGVVFGFPKSEIPLTASEKDMRDIMIRFSPVWFPDIQAALKTDQEMPAQTIIGAKRLRKVIDELAFECR